MSCLLTGIFMTAGQACSDVSPHLTMPAHRVAPAAGFLTSLPPGYVPSPKNPMPRLRRRKYAPTKSPPVVSPFKSLFGSRRQSLGGGPPAPSLMPGGAFAAAFTSAAGEGGGAGVKPEDGTAGGAGGLMPPGEVQLRHCLNARVRRCGSSASRGGALPGGWQQSGLVYCSGRAASPVTPSCCYFNFLPVCLASWLCPAPHRWCQFEFFYSAIDRPFFMQNSLQVSGLVLQGWVGVRGEWTGACPHSLLLGLVMFCRPRRAVCWVAH